MSQALQARLLEIFSQLSPGDQATVAAFSEFLLERSGRGTGAAASLLQDAPDIEIPAPLDIARPGEERVVAAVKRLSATYPMLDKTRMLGVTSDLVTQHILQGREAAGVIDDLEQAFRDEYQRLSDGD